MGGESMQRERGNTMQEPFTINLPKITEKQLLARYDGMIREAIEKVFTEQELYKPMIRMAGLCRWLDVSNTTIVKWQKAGMPHIVVDGVTLYDKHQVRKWLEQFERGDSLWDEFSNFDFTFRILPNGLGEHTCSRGNWTEETLECLIQAVLDVSDDEGISRETVKEWVEFYHPVEVTDDQTKKNSEETFENSDIYVIPLSNVTIYKKTSNS